MIRLCKSGYVMRLCKSGYVMQLCDSGLFQDAIYRLFNTSIILLFTCTTVWRGSHLIPFIAYALIARDQFLALCVYARIIITFGDVCGEKKS